MKRTETIIIGGGQAGLAMSRCLTDRGRDHLVLERGRIGQSWTERWDSLRLLSPNWMTRLPGRSYDGADPQGFMTKDNVVDMLTEYARSFDPPVLEDTTVGRVRRQHGGWQVITDRGTFEASNVVVATGACQKARIPDFASDVPEEVFQTDTIRYRNPDELPQGGVLVVGASASGVQLADEIHRSGRPVLLAVGSHIRFPRTYRGRDILWWLDRIGVLDRPVETMPDREAARREPSLQIVGSESARDLDLGVLAANGVRLAGRLTGFDGAQALFGDNLQSSIHEADTRLRKTLAKIDRHVIAAGLDQWLPTASTIPPIVTGNGPAQVDLRSRGIRSVLWATGYRRDYPWLEAPVLDRDGEIRQSQGCTAVKGLYVLGLGFMIRRRSTFIDGVGLDAREVAEQICGRSLGRSEVAA